MDRRSFLSRSSALLLAGIAGCAGDGGSTPETTTTTTATTTETTTATTTETPTTSTTTTGEGTTTGGTTTTATTTTTSTTTTTAASQSTVEVIVGVDGLRFGPETFTLSTGGEVVWKWEGNGHNVVPTSTPSGSDWSGTPGAPDRTFDSGYEYAHTFEVAGTYEYQCSVHADFGMVGSFTVV